MNIDDILRLQEAGYSADEIAKLAPLIKEAPAPKPAPQPKDDPKADERFTALNDKVDNLISTIQQLTIKQSDQPPEQQDSLIDIANTILGGMK